MDEKELIIRCQLGDMNSFDELYRHHGKKVLGTAFLIAGNRQMAEDIVQEAFIICFREIGKLKNPETFNVWFYRILVRVGWRMTEKNRKGFNRGTDVENVSVSETELVGSMEDLIETAEMKHLVRKAVKKLSLPLKTVVVLYYFNEMTVKEIARVMQCFQGTVKSRLYKARKLLRKEMEPYFECSEVASKVNGKELGLDV